MTLRSKVNALVGFAFGADDEQHDKKTTSVTQMLAAHLFGRAC